MQENNKTIHFSTIHTDTACYKKEVYIYQRHRQGTVFIEDGRAGWSSWGVEKSTLSQTWWRISVGVLFVCGGFRQRQTKPLLSTEGRRVSWFLLRMEESIVKQTDGETFWMKMYRSIVLHVTWGNSLSLAEGERIKCSLKKINFTFIPLGGANPLLSSNDKLAGHCWRVLIGYCTESWEENICISKELFTISPTTFVRDSPFLTERRRINLSCSIPRVGFSKTRFILHWSHMVHVKEKHFRANYFRTLFTNISWFPESIFSKENNVFKQKQKNIYLNFYSVDFFFSGYCRVTGLLVVFNSCYEVGFDVDVICVSAWCNPICWLDVKKKAYTYLLTWMTVDIPYGRL